MQGELSYLYISYQRLKAFRKFAASASLAVVLAIAFDPFMQNLIHYYPKLVADTSETALIARGDRYNEFGIASHHSMALSSLYLFCSVADRILYSDIR